MRNVMNFRMTLKELREIPTHPGFQAEILRLLNANCMAFTFHKKWDGGTTPRTIVGTTSLSIIPPEAWPKGVRTPPPEQCCVYDIHVHAWRSFLWENLTEVNLYAP
jgi:hypothetical protein